MEDSDLKRIIHETSADAVTRTLTSFGFDIRSPLELQKDMASLRELRKVMSSADTQADLMHLRKWRLSMESARGYTLKALTLALITGVCTALWAGFRALIQP